MNKHKFHFLYICLIALSLILGISIFNYIIDPLQVYRKHTFGEGLITDPRLQTRGLINSYLNSNMGYDSVIIGTSLTENYDTKLIHRLYGWKTLRLSMHGVHSRPLDIVGNTALKTGKVKNIIWGLHPFYMDKDFPPDHPKATFPLKLYSSQNFGIPQFLHYTINGNTTSLSWKVISAKKFKRNLHNYGLWMSERLNNGDFLKYNSKESILSLQKTLKQNRQQLRSTKLTQVGKYPALDRILELPAIYPDTNFLFIIPPVSIIYSTQPSYWKEYEAYVSHIVTKFEQHKNATLYAFDTLPHVVNNLANFKDSIHFGQGVNDYILRTLSLDKHKISAANVSTHVKAFYEMTKSWPLYSDFKSAIAYRSNHIAKMEALSKERVDINLPEGTRLFFSERQNR